MSLPMFADGWPLSAGAVNLLDAAGDALLNRAMACAVPWIEQSVGLGRDKRGYVIHRHSDDTHETECLYYDILVAGVGSGKKITVKYHGTELYAFDGSDAAHGNGRQRGLWSLHDFPTEGTHPANDTLVMVDIEHVGGDNATTATIYDLREVIGPDGYVTMMDAGDDALTDGQLANVATDLQTLATNLQALQTIAHARVPGFWPKKKEGGEVTGNTVFTVATWRFYTNKGHGLYYKIGVFKENEGARGGNKKATAKVYVQPDSAGSETLVGTFYAGGTIGQDPTGGGRGERVYEGTLNLSAISRSQNELCKVWVTVEYDGSSLDGYGGCTVYMLREEAITPPAYVNQPEFTHGLYAKGESDFPASSDPCLRRLWLNVKALAGDDGADGWGMDGKDVAGGFPFGAALLVCSNPVIFGGAQRNELPGDWIDQLSFVRTEDFLFYRADGEASLVYTDTEGEEATRSLEPTTEDDPFFVFDLAEIEDAPYGTIYTARVRLTRETYGTSKNLLFGAWEGPAD